MQISYFGLINQLNIKNSSSNIFVTTKSSEKVADSPKNTQVFFMRLSTSLICFAGQYVSVAPSLTNLPYKLVYIHSWHISSHKQILPTQRQKGGEPK